MRWPPFPVCAGLLSHVRRPPLPTPHLHTRPIASASPHPTDRKRKPTPAPSQAQALAGIIEYMLPEQITDVISHHGEGPIWHESWGGLRIVDLLAGDLLTLSDDGSIHRLPTGSPIAAFVRPRTTGGYVVGMERGIGLASDPFSIPIPQKDLWNNSNIRLNEGGVDPQGRLYAGGMPYDKTPGAACLYRIDADGSARIIIPQVTTSNGIDFSPDGRLAYYNDTPTGYTDVFDVDDSGELINRRHFHSSDGASPDGLTVDSAGNVWCALYRAGKIRLYSPEAEILGEWQLPVLGVTAITLGGPDMRDVFITTSRASFDQPGSGAIWHMRADVPGQPVKEYAG